MRYFVIMKDGTIKSAANVHEQKNSGRVYFNIDDRKYRYLTFTWDCEHYMIKHILIPTNSFQQLVHEDWIDTQEIKYIVALNEEEVEELNHFQSTDFNAGMLYSAIEKDVMRMVADTGVLSHSSNYSIPDIQITPKNCVIIDEDKTIDAIIRATTEHFEAIHGKTFKLAIYSWQCIRQKYLFFYNISRKENYKEMTVAEIEEALGYKIKIVGHI